MYHCYYELRKMLGNLIGNYKLNEAIQSSDRYLEYLKTKSFSQQLGFYDGCSDVSSRSDFIKPIFLIGFDGFIVRNSPQENFKIDFREYCGGYLSGYLKFASKFRRFKDFRGKELSKYKISRKRFNIPIRKDSKFYATKGNIEKILEKKGLLI